MQRSTQLIARRHVSIHTAIRRMATIASHLHVVNNSNSIVNARVPSSKVNLTNSNSTGQSTILSQPSRSFHQLAAGNPNSRQSQHRHRQSAFIRASPVASSSCTCTCARPTQFTRQLTSPSTASPIMNHSNSAPAAGGADAAQPHADRETPLTETVRYFLEPRELYESLKEQGIDFYTGVPDSLLKDFCGYVSDVAPASKHIIAANEGAAMGIGAGYHLATSKFPLVYMQNSGFGNTVNPLLSLCDSKVYGIPMLLLIGWRGEPGKKDEPQHIVQGKVMSSLLTDLNISFEVLPDYIEGARESIATAVHYMKTRRSPYALLVKRQTFTNYKMKTVELNRHTISREQALSAIVDSTDAFDILVSTTGFTSRELYELRESRHQGHEREFLTVGSMGHASSIAFGIALAKPSRLVYCIDGDGAALMHMGSIATIGTRSSLNANYRHILINNGSHDSVGGQPTQGFDIQFTEIAKNCGYKHVETVSTSDELKRAMKSTRSIKGAVMIQVLVNKGARKNLGRPKTSPLQNKQEFMSFLEN